MCILEQIGKRMRWLRESKEWTVRKLARLCEVSVSDIQALEAGRVKPPYSLYESACRVMGYKTDDLFGVFDWTYTPKCATSVPQVQFIIRRVGQNMREGRGDSIVREAKAALDFIRG